VVSTE